MKYNLLPDSFHYRFDTLEEDWSEMTSDKFLAEAQKCELMDAKQREATRSNAKARETMVVLRQTRRKRNFQNFPKEIKHFAAIANWQVPRIGCANRTLLQTAGKKSSIRRQYKIQHLQNPLITIVAITPASASIVRRRKR